MTARLPPRAPKTLPAGTRLGPYEVLSAVGAGGMGEVYKAIDTRLDRLVAVKIVGALAGSRPELRQCFEREARVISSLSHPHICAMFDVGEAPLAPDGALMSVTLRESSDGRTLAPNPPQRLFRPAIVGGGSIIIGATQQYDVSADGHRFLINMSLSEASASPISIVLNWTAALRK